MLGFVWLCFVIVLISCWLIRSPVIQAQDEKQSNELKNKKQNQSL